MKAVLTRVKYASVAIDGETVGKIGQGFLILLGVGPQDTEKECRLLAEKALGLRIFEDENGKMNVSPAGAGAKILIVSQFTLYGDCRQRRPGAQPHPGAHGGAQQTGCGEKQGSKDKIGQQKLVEVDHAFQCRSPLAASVPPGGGKACRNRKPACGLYKSNTFIDLVSHFLHFLQKGT